MLQEMFTLCLLRMPGGFFFSAVEEDLHLFVLSDCCWWKCSSAFSWSGSKTNCPHSSMTEGAVLSHAAVCEVWAKHITHNKTPYFSNILSHSRLFIQYLAWWQLLVYSDKVWIQTCIYVFSFSHKKWQIPFLLRNDGMHESTCKLRHLVIISKCTVPV